MIVNDKGAMRVGMDFNPSQSTEINQVKGVTASLIDNLESLNTGGDEEVARWAAMAQTKYEEACMWAVKAIANAERRQQ